MQNIQYFIPRNGGTSSILDHNPVRISHASQVEESRHLTVLSPSLVTCACVSGYKTPPYLTLPMAKFSPTEEHISFSVPLPPESLQRTKAAEHCVAVHRVKPFPSAAQDGSQNEGAEIGRIGRSCRPFCLSTRSPKPRNRAAICRFPLSCGLRHPCAFKSLSTYGCNLFTPNCIDYLGTELHQKTCNLLIEFKCILLYVVSKDYMNNICFYF